eukprot:scaffold496_cov119-Isochrysis_galbana.AAC.1
MPHPSRGREAQSVVRSEGPKRPVANGVHSPAGSGSTPIAASLRMLSIVQPLRATRPAAGCAGAAHRAHRPKPVPRHRHNLEVVELHVDASLRMPHERGAMTPERPPQDIEEWSRATATQRCDRGVRRLGRPMRQPHRPGVEPRMCICESIPSPALHHIAIVSLHAAQLGQATLEQPPERLRRIIAADPAPASRAAAWCARQRRRLMPDDRLRGGRDEPEQVVHCIAHAHVPAGPSTLDHGGQGRGRRGPRRSRCAAPQVWQNLPPAAALMPRCRAARSILCSRLHPAGATSEAELQKRGPGVHTPRARASFPAKRPKACFPAKGSDSDALPAAPSALCNPALHESPAVDRPAPPDPAPLESGDAEVAAPCAPVTAAPHVVCLAASSLTAGEAWKTSCGGSGSPPAAWRNGQLPPRRHAPSSRNDSHTRRSTDAQASPPTPTPPGGSSLGMSRCRLAGCSSSTPSESSRPPTLCVLPLLQPGPAPRLPPPPGLLPVGTDRIRFGGAARTDFGGTIRELANMMDGLGTLKSGSSTHADRAAAIASSFSALIFLPTIQADKSHGLRHKMAQR